MEIAKPELKFKMLIIGDPAVGENKSSFKIYR